MKNPSKIREEIRSMRTVITELRLKVRAAADTETRLSNANCRFQLEIHNLTIETRALVQALHDCQKLRKHYQDEVQRLNLKIDSSSPV